MKKIFEVVMLSTEKAKGIHEKCLWLSSLGKDLHYELAGYAEHKIEGVNKQHLYILSDEKIEQGESVIVFYKGNVYIHITAYKDAIGWIMVGDYKFDQTAEFKKVIASTDKLLIRNDLSKKHNSDEYYLPQIPESFIQEYVKKYNEGKPTAIVDLEVEEVRSATYEPSTKWIVPKTNSSNAVIICEKEKEEPSSRELEVLELCKRVIDVSPNTHYNPNGADTSTCPFCYADVKHANASMYDIKHDPKDCAWLLAKDLSTNLI